MFRVTEVIVFKGLKKGLERIQSCLIFFRGRGCPKKYEQGSASNYIWHHNGCGLCCGYVSCSGYDVIEPGYCNSLTKQCLVPYKGEGVGWYCSLSPWNVGDNNERVIHPLSFGAVDSKDVPKLS